jgi:hypothetical protein
MIGDVLSICLAASMGSSGNLFPGQRLTRPSRRRTNPATNKTMLDAMMRVQIKGCLGGGPVSKSGSRSPLEVLIVEKVDVGHPGVKLYIKNQEPRGTCDRCKAVKEAKRV